MSTTTLMSEPMPPVSADYQDRAAQRPAFDVVTLRDHFATAAMAGYLAAHAGPDIGLPKRTEVAEYSYQLADEMLKRRAMPTTPPAPSAD